MGKVLLILLVVVLVIFGNKRKTEVVRFTTASMPIESLKDSHGVLLVWQDQQKYRSLAEKLAKETICEHVARKPLYLQVRNMCECAHRPAIIFCHPPIRGPDSVAAP